MSRILDNIAELNPEALFPDGFEKAIIGHTMGHFSPIVSVYSYERCVTILMVRDGMTLEEAEEYMDYNVLGAYVGENGPVFVRTDVP